MLKRLIRVKVVAACRAQTLKPVIGLALRRRVIAPDIPSRPLASAAMSDFMHIEQKEMSKKDAAAPRYGALGIAARHT
ncbi:MAG: hypothetical protein ACR2PA_19485 [Hyphomicrobiaceae bacterium]